MRASHSNPDFLDLDSPFRTVVTQGLLVRPVRTQSPIVILLVSLFALLSPLSKIAMLPPALLGGAGFLLRLEPGDDGGAALVAVEQVVDLLGEVLAGQLAVLLAGACVLALDDYAGGNMLELDG